MRRSTSDSQRPPEMTVHDRVTLIDLFEAVDEFAESNAEVMATLRLMFEA